MARIILVASSSKSLINFRGVLIKQLVEKSHEVYCVADDNHSVGDKVQELGAKFVASPIRRSSQNPLSDLSLLFFYVRVFNRLKPDFVISYTIKPVIWSGIALFFNKKVKYYPLITGLGYLFYGEGFKRSALRFIVSRIYRTALNRAECVFFQNNDDKEELTNRSILRAKKTQLLPGSGVPLQHYEYSEVPEFCNGLKFVMVARLLKDKGVYQYVEAARQIKERYPDTQFILVGGLDPSPNGVLESEVESWTKDNIVKCIGNVSDVRPYVISGHVFVLPSFYREGLPRSILEAMSIGRAILTTDNVGCRDPINQGVNGFIVKPKSTEALVEKLEWFIQNPHKIQSMGLASRRLAEQVYDVNKVNKLMFDTMGL